MNILAIESSCDETAAAVVRDGRTVLSRLSCISDIEMHTIYGGVVPEIASREACGGDYRRSGGTGGSPSGPDQGRAGCRCGYLRPGAHRGGAGGGELCQGWRPWRWTVR